jgi:hypothetical protein
LEYTDKVGKAAGADPAISIDDRIFAVSLSQAANGPLSDNRLSVRTDRSWPGGAAGHGSGRLRQPPAPDNFDGRRCRGARGTVIGVPGVRLHS